MDIFQKALNELAVIESEITEKIRRRDTLREFISMGQQLFQDSRNRMAHGALTASGATQLERVIANRIIRSNTLSSRVGAVTEAILKANGPTTTKDLLPLLEAQGIEIGGENKMSTLSVLLSRNGKFVADRSTGWKLRSDEDELPGLEQRSETIATVFPHYSAKGMPQSGTNRTESATKNNTSGKNNNDDEL